MSGARPGAMPASPSKRGRATKLAGVSSAVVSGVTMMHCRVRVVVGAWSAIDDFIQDWCLGRRPRENIWGFAPRHPVISKPVYELFLLRFLPLFFGLFDDADVHEGVFRQVVPFAVADLFEAADC